MSWQKCPICHGTGKDAEEIALFGLNSGVPLKPCDVCDGKKIIHTDTGKPPKNSEEEEREASENATAALNRAMKLASEKMVDLKEIADRWSDLNRHNEDKKRNEGNPKA